MSLKVRRSSLQLTSEIEVTGLNTPGKVSQTIGGSWKCDIEIPAIPTSRPKAAESYLRIRVSPISESTGDHRQLGVVTISITLNSLEGETLKARSIERDPVTGEDKWIDLYALSPPSTPVLRDRALIVVVTLSNIPPPTRPVIDHQLLLENVLDLMEGQDIIDTKFVVFSNRQVLEGVSGACDPLPVYANSKLICSQCDYFEKLLSDTNSSNVRVETFGQLPTRLDIEEYVDDVDSDLGYVTEDEGETEDADDWDQPGPSSAVSTQSVANLSHELQPVDQDVNREPIKNPERRPLPLERRHQRHHNEVGKVVEINDFAYVTWKALIFYLCTSQIAFAPLSSSLITRTRSTSERVQGLPSKPSAKSIYRAALKLKLDDLAKMALNHIKSQLTEDIAIEELFSKYTSQFEEVRKIELKFVFDHWKQLRTSTALEEKMLAFAKGEISYAYQALASLMAHLKS